MFTAVDLWLHCRNSKGRHLPFPGGIGNQPAILWDAFGILSRLWDEAEKQEC